MTMYTIEALVFVDTEDDPEDVANHFASGFYSTVSHFPGIVDTEVTGIRPATPGEVEEHSE